MWDRDLDLLVPMWQGSDDVRVRAGAAALAVLTSPAAGRVTLPVRAEGSERVDGVRHLGAVVETWQAQGEVLERHRPARLLTLGGDCAVEVPSVTYLVKKYAERLFVLWIDAHGDLNTPASSPSGTAHGMPLRLLLDKDAGGPLPAPGCLSPERVALVGTRDLDVAESEFVHGQDLTLLDVPTVTANPPRLAELPPSGAAVYVHLDLDVLDPVALPAIAVPTADGLAPTVLAQALATLNARHDVVGVGITEYVPQLEHDRQVLSQVLTALGLSSVAVN